MEDRQECKAELVSRSGESGRETGEVRLVLDIYSICTFANSCLSSFFE